jgi:hypothetical protein
MNQSIKVEDLAVPPSVTVITPLDSSVASVVPPVSEADLEADLGLEDEEIEDGELAEDGEEVPEEEGEATEAEETENESAPE